MVLGSAVLRALLAWRVYFLFFGLVIKYGALRETLASLGESRLRSAWTFVLITAGIQLFVILAFVVSDPTRLWQASFFNVFMSVGTALAGGVGEEIAYRRVIVLRLEAAGASKRTI